MSQAIEANCINEFLWIGSFEAACAPLPILKEYNIKYILTVGNNMEPLYKDDIIYKILNLDDVPQECILQYFKECFLFINKAKDNLCNILIHCAAGRSRSVTILTSYLMISENISCTDALTRIQNKRSIAQPNSGFMYQLKLFQRLGNCLDILDPEVELNFFTNILDEKALQELAVILNNNRIYKSMKKEYDINRKDKRETFPPDSNWKLPNFYLASNLPKLKFQCNYCSYDLVTELDHINHKIYPMSSFLYMGRKNNLCDKVFISYKDWMGIIDTCDNDILCPQCKFEVGEYLWYGRNCACGTNISPAFYLHTNSVNHISN